MGLPAELSSTWAYYGCLALPGALGVAGSVTVELYVGAIPADPASETDFTRPTFPGYAPVVLNVPGTVVPDDPSSAETVPADPVTFQATGPPPGGTHATGWFAYDASGITLFYGPFAGAWNVINTGDFLTLSLSFYAFYSFI